MLKLNIKYVKLDIFTLAKQQEPQIPEGGPPPGRDPDEGLNAVQGQKDALNSWCSEMLGCEAKYAK